MILRTQIVTRPGERRGAEAAIFPVQPARAIVHGRDFCPPTLSTQTLFTQTLITQTWENRLVG